MNVRQVTAYQCADNTLFLTRDAASVHDFKSLLQSECASRVQADKQTISQIVDIVCDIIGRFTPISDMLLHSVMEHLRHQDKIAAIKRYHELTGKGIRESKNDVEMMGVREGLLTKVVSGCGEVSYVFASF